MISENLSQIIPSKKIFYFSRIYEDHFKTVFILTLLLILILAWNHRWMADDAFISFRYAENFVHGNGLVWNNGEFVEGYTNFLWTILISGFIALGGNPAIWSQVFGILFFAASLLYMYKLSKLIFQSKNIGFLLMILLGLNHTFNSFATGGLETQMQVTLLLSCTHYCTLNILSTIWTIKRMITISLLITAAILTRLDSAAICIIILAITFVSFIYNGLTRKNIWKHTLTLTALTIIIVGLWFLWKLFYYGTILPNTYYAKVASPTSMQHGMYYIYAFHLAYFLIPFPLILLFKLKVLLSKVNLHLMMLCLCITLWFAYLIYIGGDHIEFRFIVPVMPFIFILIGWVIFIPIHHWSIRVILIALILAGSIYHAATYVQSADPSMGIAPLRHFDEEFTKEYPQWSKAGRALWEAFKGNKDILIATSGAGAIPYYSQLPTIDMLGINDPWIARHGEILGTTPGHQRISPMSYLVKRKVNLLLGHPTIVRNFSELKQIPLAPMDSSCQFSEAALIIIPISSEENLIALYLTESHVVDEAIKKYGWSVLWVRIKQNPLNEF